jgi:hypothetical protein
MSTSLSFFVDGRYLTNEVASRLGLAASCYLRASCAMINSCGDKGEVLLDISRLTERRGPMEFSSSLGNRPSVNPFLEEG